MHCTVRWRWQANATRDHAAAEFPSVVEEGVAGWGRGSGEVRARNTSTASPRPAQSGHSFHAGLVSHYAQEYIQYLQTLGFMLIELRPPPAQSSKRSKSSLGEEGGAGRRRHTTGRAGPGGGTARQTSYLQKSLLGGILIFEIGVCEPFFYTKLHALEAGRIQLRTSQATTGKNFVSTFLDKCDQINVHCLLYSVHHTP